VILAVWWRWLTAAVAGQRRILSLLLDYARRCRDAERAFDTALHERARNVAIVRAEHVAELAELHLRVGEYRAEAVASDLARQEAERQIRLDRVSANSAWHRLGQVGQIADRPDTPPHVADAIRAITHRTLPALQGAPADD
jgi:hypothetical protein